MRYINVSNNKPINIGRRGEESVTTVRFSINAFFPHMPSSATYGLIHQRHNDAAPYPCTIAVANGYINWVVGSGDLANVGNGTAQLSAYLNGAVAKTVIFTTVTTDSMGATNPPDPQQIWIDEVINASNRAEQAAAEAKEIRDGIEPEIVWTAYGQLTSAQLDALYQAGKLVAFKSTSGNGLTYLLTKRVNATTHEFTAVNETQIRCVRVVNNTWFDTDVYNLTTEGYVTSYVGSKASNNTPADLAVTPSAGSSLDFSRADHVHKKELLLINEYETSNAKIEAAYQAGVLVLLKYQQGYLPLVSRNSATKHTFIGFAEPVGLTQAVLNNGTWSFSSSKVVTQSFAANTAPKDLGAAASSGTSEYFSRADHVHKRPSAADIGAYVKPAGGIPASDLASGVIPEAEVFWATYGTTTNAEIEAAYQAGKIVMCLYNSSYALCLTYRPSASRHRFSAVTSGGSLFWATCENDSWTHGSEILAPANSPYFTGTPKAPTAASGTNTTQIATTAFVQNEVAGKYTKPSGGIPKADLASAVQASLDKADTALQGEGLSDDVKQALLQLAQKVAYIDAHGSDYYQDLYDALYPSTPIELTGITATFAQGTHTIFDTDSLDDLKPYLTVTANYSDSSSATVIGYTLSGTLTAGTSTITASYQGKTATFTVTVSHTPIMTGITATFNQGTATIYDTDSLDSLKTYLTVTVDYDTGASSTVTNYTLSGTLAAGSSTITASYGGFTDTFTVTVTERVAVLESITASFSQGSATIYDDDSLNSLKQYLTVTAHYSDSTSAAVSDYTLSGTLSTGTSTITVTYNGKTDTFNVTVTHRAAVYTVSNTLEHCTSSNAATSATEGDSYSATIISSQGYMLNGATVAVTMGGTDITSTAYSNGTISIANVTGNISISVSAVQIVMSSISASYTQSGTVYDTDSLDSLKSDLVVTATYNNGSTATVPSADYTLSGTLTEGTSTITVSYVGKTTTFNVTVTHNPYWLVLSIADDFVEGTGTGGSWSDTYGGYFVKNTNRCACSVFLNHVMELGYKYTFECNISNNKNFGVPYYKAAALTAVQNHQGIGGSAGYFIADPGWKTHGYVFTPPEDCIAQIQFNATQAALLAAGITELRIIKEAVS